MLLDRRLTRAEHRRHPPLRRLHHHLPRSREHPRLRGPGRRSRVSRRRRRTGRRGILPLNRGGRARRRLVGRGAPDAPPHGRGQPRAVRAGRREQEASCMRCPPRATVDAHASNVSQEDGWPMLSVHAAQSGSKCQSALPACLPQTATRTGTRPDCRTDIKGSRLSRLGARYIVLYEGTVN